MKMRSRVLLAGNPARLTFGIDSYGNVCGSDNTAAGGPDLRGAKKLYYLNPLELLQPSLAFLAARTVCVVACPTAASLCNVTSLPCLADAQYRYSAWLPAPRTHQAGASAAAGLANTAAL